MIELYQTGLESIQGYTTIISIIEYPNAVDYFKNLTILYPSYEDYETAIILSKALYTIGKPIPAMDVIIAAISYNSKLVLISKDKHFEHVKEVWGDFNISKELD